MNEIRTRLQQDDPLRHDSELNVHDAERMRRVVLAASGERPIGSMPGWLALATVAAVVVTIGTLAVRTRHHAPVSDGARLPVVTAPPDAENLHPRQLHFVTRGGTRVIWIFNNELDVR